MNPKFSFPFEPYDIQKKFMNELYFTIDKKKLGIFESPTGTGKSLSICCGSLQWLKDNNKQIEEDLIKEISDLKSQLKNDTDDNDWLNEEYNKIQKNQLLLKLQSKLSKLKERVEKFKELQKRVAKQSTQSNKFNGYFTKRDSSAKNEVKVEEGTEDIADEDLIVECEKSQTDSDDEVLHEDDKDSFTKIYISSRTHSQLSQFIGEIKTTVFNNNTRVVTLASRQHYCINTDVNKLKNVSLINERCLDMQKYKSKSTAKDKEGKVTKKSKTKSCSSCPYYNQNNITKFKERLLVNIMDMEDIVKSGKQLRACPYYASRMALEDAEVVLISHAGVVSQGARAGVSLNLQDNILILDEAHGLTAALENAHSAPVSVQQLSSVNTALESYINRYRSLLSSGNLLQLNQISFVIGKLLAMVKPTPSATEDGAKIYTLEDFVIKADIGHLRLRPLVEFSRRTRLANKLHGFSARSGAQAQQHTHQEHQNSSAFKNFLSSMSKHKEHKQGPVEAQCEIQQQVEASPQCSAGSALYAVLVFLQMLCERGERGRVLADPAGGLLKYLLLNPADQFAEVVEQCRSVILAGGTMEPVSEFLALLAPHGAQDRVHVVRCGHVVPPENVLGICLSTGPSNIDLNFSYENRSSKELLGEACRALRGVCGVVPHGVVCFVPSYSYERALYEHLSATTLLQAISRTKKVFREPRSAADVEQVLQQYGAAAKGEAGGALLLSVVGGKLSEGLNFSDELGRCVVVVGMPYPNVKSLELQEKMSYLNSERAGAGAALCEQLCVKAVNQCVGRAVRHAGDHAAVLLLDRRYSRPRTAAALPAFLQKSLQLNCSFGRAIGSTAKFFARHKKNKL